MAWGTVDEIVNNKHHVEVAPAQSIHEWLAQLSTPQDLLDSSFPRLDSYALKKWQHMASLASPSSLPEDGDVRAGEKCGEVESSSDEDEELSIICCGKASTGGGTSGAALEGMADQNEGKRSESQPTFLGRPVSRETSEWMTAYLAKRRAELVGASSGAVPSIAKGVDAAAAACKAVEGKQQGKKRKRKRKATKSAPHVAWRHLREMAKKPDYDDTVIINNPKPVVEPSQSLIMEIAEEL